MMRSLSDELVAGYQQLASGSVSHRFGERKIIS